LEFILLMQQKMPSTFSQTDSTSRKMIQSTTDVLAEADDLSTSLWT
jgi:hypothetical protein